MGIFRRRKQFRNRDGEQEAEPLPYVVRQIVAEQAAKFVDLKQRERQAYAARHPYEPVPPLPEVLEIPMPGYDGFIDESSDEYASENIRPSSPLNAIASALGFRRDSPVHFSRPSSPAHFSRRGSPTHFSRRGSPTHFSRACSPEHLRHRPPGSPMKFRRRPPSPEIIRSRPSSPYFLDEYERPLSPHHFVPRVRSRHSHQSEKLQNFERQQRFQEEMMMLASLQYPSQYQYVQQPYYSLNPVGNYQVYPMAQQQMYSYY